MPALYSRSSQFLILFLYNICHSFHLSISFNHLMYHYYYDFEQTVIRSIHNKKTERFILPSFIPSLIFFWCRSEFLTCIISFFLNKFPLTFLARQVFWWQTPEIFLTENVFLLYFQRIIIWMQNSLLFSFSTKYLTLLFFACMISEESSRIIFILVALYIFFSLLASSEMIFLSLTFCCLNRRCLSVGFCFIFNFYLS